MIGAWNLRRDERGSAVVEAALALPIIVATIYGIYQMACLFYANAGMQHALGEGARHATLYSANRSVATSTTTGGVTTAGTKTVNYPTATEVQSRMSAKLFGRTDGAFNVNVPTGGTTSTTTTGTSEWYDLRITYTRKMNLLFVSGPTVTLVRTKRVYLAAS